MVYIVFGTTVFNLFIGEVQLATSKGLVAGDLKFTDADGNVVDCATYKAVRCCFNF